jgi:hypothetical protein
MSIKLAILDLNDNTPNLGLGSIVEHANSFGDEVSYQILMSGTSTRFLHWILICTFLPVVPLILERVMVHGR